MFVHIVAETALGCYGVAVPTSSRLRSSAGAEPATREQAQAWLILVRFLQERYDIPVENIYAHNWIDFKDRRYCEGCELATLARRKRRR